MGQPGLALSEEQRRVVDSLSSCLCVAGPGSGKTRTLVAKAEKLYSEDKDFICLTFTRNAASEMRYRMPGILAQTIHSFCYGQVDWKGDYDRLLSDFQFSSRKPKYEWVLVDEVQDLTESQLEVVLGIVGNNLLAVGDPYQSIYGFNGALGGRVVSRFKEMGCQELYLKGNYRSCPGIVELLNGLYARGLVSAGVRTTGLTAILARTNADVAEVTGLLESVGIGYTVKFGASELRSKGEVFHGNENLKVMTCHCSKGLEFDWVILYKWHPERAEKDCFNPRHAKEDLVGSQEERNLLYVSIARASMGFCMVDTLNRLLSALGCSSEEREIGAVRW